jgi:hypothetical protein
MFSTILYVVGSIFEKQKKKGNEKHFPKLVVIFKMILVIVSNYQAIQFSKNIHFNLHK